MLTTSLRLVMLQDFSSIGQDDWHRLVLQSPTCTIFQTLPYIEAWWAAFGRGKLLVIAAYEDDRLAAIAPLFADHGMVFFVGSGGSDYLNFIGEVSTLDTLRAVLDLARAHTPGFVGFRFYHVPDSSPTGRWLTGAAADLDLDCFDEGSLSAPALRFGDWPADKRPPSEKKSLLRHERVLRSQGELRVDHFVEYSKMEPLLPQFFDQHIARWEGTRFPSLFLDEKQREFYRQLAQRNDSTGWLRFTRLLLNEQPIAFHFGFSFQGSFLWYKPSFAIECAHQSPGEVLLRSLILQAYSEEARVFDFGLGDESFKERFQTETQLVRTWGLYPHNSSLSTSSAGTR